MLRTLLWTALALLPSCASPSARPGPRAPEPPGGEVAQRKVAPPAPTPLPAPAATPAPAAIEPPAPPDEPAAPPESTWAFYRERYDADHDGEITRAEYTRSDAGFRYLDVDRDGALTGKDFAPRWDGRPRVGPGKRFVYGEGGPEAGDRAPDFRLRSTDGEEFTLARFLGHKPVVLVFGSFT